MNAALRFVSITLLLGLATITAQATDSEAGFQIIQSGELNWQPVPGGLGTEFAVLQGDPSKVGVYVIRVRFPAGVMDTPHFHNADRYVTVVEGSWYAGVGDVFDPDTAQEITAGGYMFHPAGAAHWDGAKGSKDAVVQIIGHGPVSTEPSNDKEPMWLRVHD